MDSLNTNNIVDVDWGGVNKNGLIEFDKIAFATLEKMNKTSSHLSIILASDDDMKNYNKLYRGMDSTTDVLSFAFNEDSFVCAGEQQENELGEIYISIKEVLQNSKIYNVPFLEELARVTIHGVLHLLGYDHKTNDTKNEEMLILQEKILKEIVENDN